MKTLLFSIILLATAQNQPSQVYTTATGKKYHTHKDCQYIKGRDTKTITLKQAQTDNKTLCSRCASLDKKGASK